MCTEHAPTPLSAKNLKEENAHKQICVTGNTAIDALPMVVEVLHSDQALAEELVRVLRWASLTVK